MPNFTIHIHDTDSDAVPTIEVGPCETVEPYVVVNFASGFVWFTHVERIASLRDAINQYLEPTPPPSEIIAAELCAPDTEIAVETKDMANVMRYIATPCAEESEDIAAF